MEADVTPDTKTHKRTEDATIAQVVNEDSSSARKVDIGPTTSTSFGMITESPALLCRDDALVGKGAEALRPCLSPVEIHTLPAAGGLLPADTVSTAIRTIVSRSLPSWTLGEETKERTSQTGRNQLAPPCCRRIKRNQSKLQCSILAVLQVVHEPARFWEGGARCFVGRFSFGRRMVSEAGAFLVDAGLRTLLPKRGTSDSLRRTYWVDRCFPEAKLVQGSRQTARIHRNCRYNRMLRNIMQRGA